MKDAYVVMSCQRSDTVRNDENLDEKCLMAAALHKDDERALWQR